MIDSRTAGSIESVSFPRAENTDSSLRISAQMFGRLARFINEELGIKMPESKLPMIQSRLFRRVHQLGFGSLDDYCEFLFSSDSKDQERVYLIDAVTTNKTDFFREPQHFNILTKQVLPELEQSSGAGIRSPLALWSAPCSSGQEPYTLAMVLSEYAVSHPGFRFQILATDVSTKVLRAAVDGIYAKDLVEPVPMAYRRKYLLSGKGQSADLVRITPALRKLVSFRQLNFMDSVYQVTTMFDVIFCRNVLIYFDRATQEAVINKLCRHLQPGGFLFVSHSESLSGLEIPLNSLGSSCFRKIE